MNILQGLNWRLHFKNTLRGFLYKALERDWIESISSRYKGLAMCLSYHRVHPISKKENFFHPNLSLVVTPEAFEDQISFVSRNYNCLDINRAVNLLNNDKLPERALIITFDDGYLDNITYALPILKKYNVPADIFITTGFPDGTCILWWYELEHILREINSLRFVWKEQAYSWDFKNVALKYKAYREIRSMFVTSTLEEQQELLAILRSSCRNDGPSVFENAGMSWEDIIALDREPLISIGSHTIFHPSLTQLRDEEVFHEMKGSKERLEEVLKHPIDTFSYPFGSPVEADKRVSMIAEQIGYKCAVACIYGHIQKEHKNHPYSIPRIPITFYDTMPRFKIKLSGIYALLRQRGKKVVTVY